MIYIYIGIGIVFIAALILILLKDEKDEIDSILVKIDESEDNIDILLEKKLKILCDVSKTINEKEEDKILTNIGKIKNKALDSFGLYKELNKNNKELNDFIEGYEYVLPDEEDKMMKDLYNTNIEIKALLKFYNKNVELYNKIISKFSRLLLRIIKRYSKKETFEIEDEVEFEILKEKN